MKTRSSCPVCLRPRSLQPLRAGDEDIAGMISVAFPSWKESAGICRDCLHQLAYARQVLPESLRDEEGRLLPILPIALRLQVPKSGRGRGVTIAFLDSGFYPHPDLVTPTNRILLYHNVLDPAANGNIDVDTSSWHGMMTSVVCTGNGACSSGFYRGLAPEADLVLVKVGTARRIRPEHIAEGLRWVREHRERFAIRIVNVSCGGDDPAPYLLDPICQEVEALVREGVVVVCVAGNRGNAADHEVIPPASSPSAITVGGYDDGNAPGMRRSGTYWSSFGPTIDGLQKPEVIAPSIWIAAPILPESPSHAQALLLEELDAASNRDLPAVLRRHRALDPLLEQVANAPPIVIRNLVAALKRDNNLIGGHYKHVDGTSFAAPIVSSLVALALEVRPELKPWEIKRALLRTAKPLACVRRDIQGWGVIQAPRFLAELRIGSGEHLLQTRMGSGKGLHPEPTDIDPESGNDS